MWEINYPVTRLVSRHRGTLPVILTCPRDGDESPSRVPERKGQGIPSDCNFKKSRDRHTLLITTGVAQRLLDVFGEAPYVVIAESDRQHINANCKQAYAFEHPKAQQYYDQCHNTIREFRNEILPENGGLGLLFDIHRTAGIDSDPADLYSGTVAGQTIARLLKVDPQALWRRRSLRGFLTAAGYIVSPKQPNIPETPAVIGGYTGRTYGSSNADGFDVIQIEIASFLRDDAGKSEALIGHLAYAMGSLAARHADTHTLAVFESIDLFGGGIIKTVYWATATRSRNQR
jgi:hypothetical protein